MTDALAYAADDVRAAEQPLLAAGVPLMQRAAGALADRIALRRSVAPGSVVVLVGSGDNGADALFAAARLGAGITAVQLGRRVHERALAAARAAGVTVLRPDDAAADDAFANARWIVDAVLGIGVRHPELRPAAAAAVARLAPRVDAKQAEVVAVDLPSGLDPDDGSVRGPVLRASETVTFGALKPGLVLGDGPPLAGEVTLVELGLDLTSARPVAAGSVARRIDATAGRA